MNTLSSPHPPEFYQTLPKVELHRHLEGSLRIPTMMEVARSHGMAHKATAFLRPLVQIQADEPLTFDNFLSKFGILREFFLSPEVITRITREAILDAAADRVRYLELRFTPVALSKAGGYPLAEVMDWVVDASQKASSESGMLTRLIASINRHESTTLATQVALLSVERRNKGIVGLDLAGNEAKFPVTPFIGIFKAAQQAGLHITIHAGEWGVAEHVASAITQLNAERIGHGVRVMEDPRVVALARERAIPFEVCVTSNYQSGVVSSISAHPLPEMMAAGLNVTLNTDDPSISRITLSDEYRMACEEMGFSQPTLHGCLLAAAEAAFLQTADRQKLVNKIHQELSTLLT